MPYNMTWKFDSKKEDKNGHLDRLGETAIERATW